MSTRFTTRDRILEAATALIWRDGYLAVSVDMMCAAAGVQKGSFYHAFPSKAALLFAAISLVRDADLSELEAVRASAANPDERLRRHLEWFGTAQRRLKARYGFVPGTFNMVLDVNVPEEVKVVARDGLNQHHLLIQSSMTELLEPRGVSVEVRDWLATTVMHLIHGVIIGARLGNSLVPFDTMPETVFSLLGLTPPPVLNAEDDVLTFGAADRWSSPPVEPSRASR